MFDWDLPPSLVFYSNEWRNTYYDYLKMNYVSEGVRKKLQKDQGHLCYYFSDRMDGMKSKLLNLISEMPRDEFRHTFFACSSYKDKDGGTGSTFRDTLRAIDGNMNSCTSYIHIYIYVYIYIYMYTRIFVHAYTYVNILHTHTYVHALIHTYIHLHIFS